MSSEQKENNIQKGEIQPSEQVGKVFLDFVSIIIKRKRFFVFFVGGVTLVAGIIAALSPKWYKATASVFPAEQTDVLGALSGVSSLVKSFSAGSKLSALGAPSEIDRYMAILKSERALMEVINKFDLAKEYGITSYVREKTMKELLSNVEFEESDEGALVISVYDKTPEKSAEMANYFVQVLNEINSDMKAQNARANREFIEQRYQKNIQDLQNAENALRDYQKKTGTMILPLESTSSISAIAELYGMKAKKEIELAILEKTVTKDNPALQQLSIEVRELDKKIATIPSTATESFRLYRDVAIQQKIMEFLTPVLEQAKVEEKRETPSVIVLDHALIPERKAKPKILLFALIGFVSSSVISLFVVFAAEGRERLKKLYPEQYSSIFLSLRRGWFRTTR